MDSVDKQLTEMSKELKSRSKAKVVLEAGLYTLVVLLLLVGNSLTLFIISFNRQMRTVPNMLVASLALTDFLFGLLSASPLGISTLAASQWPFGDTTCQYQGYMVVTLALTSTKLLALMAVNRYFRIVSPAKYRRYFTWRKTAIMILVLWFFGIWAPLPYLLSGHKMVFHPSKFFCYLQIDSGPYTAFMVTVYIGLPTCVIFYCYLRIFQTVRSHNTNFQNSGIASHTVNVEEVKITRTLFVIVVFFNLCWTPILLIDIVDTIRGTWTFPREVYVAYSFLATISSAMNPIIYGVLNKNFQKEYRKILCCSYCSYCCTQGLVEPFVPTDKKRSTVETAL